MKPIFTIVIALFLCSYTFGQVGINSASPTTTLDIVAKNTVGSSTSIDGILIPRVDRERAQSMASVPDATLIYVNSVATGTAAAKAINIVSVGFYSFDTLSNTWLRFQTGGTDWNIAGNAATSPTINYVGTTDAIDLVFKTNAIERMRINNAIGSTTGTAGDISIGDVLSGTLKSNKEFVIKQDGDIFGSSTLRLRHRNGENGAVFETLNPTSPGVHLVDFIFKTGTTAVPQQTNIRFEARLGSQKVAGNTTEWQFGQPDSTNGGPTLVIGANGNGSNSAFRLGNVGIGTVLPKAKLHNDGTTAFTTATSGTNNTIILQNAGTFLTPAASADTNGRVYIIRNTSTTANLTVNTIIDYNASVAANFALTPTVGSIVIVCDGTNWYRIQ